MYNDQPTRMSDDDDAVISPPRSVAGDDDDVAQALDDVDADVLAAMDADERPVDERLGFAEQQLQPSAAIGRQQHQQQSAASPQTTPQTTPSGACGVCSRPVRADDDRVVRGACAHVYHFACMTPFVQAARAYCLQCTLAHRDEQAAAVGGFSIDTGNDADVRTALEHRRNQVRDKFLARAAADAQGA